MRLALKYESTSVKSVGGEKRIECPKFVETDFTTEAAFLRAPKKMRPNGYMSTENIFIRFIKRTFYNLNSIPDGFFRSLGYEMWRGCGPTASRSAPMAGARGSPSLRAAGGRGRDIGVPKVKM